MFLTGTVPGGNALAVSDQTSTKSRDGAEGKSSGFEYGGSATFSRGQSTGCVGNMESAATCCLTLVLAEPSVLCPAAIPIPESCLTLLTDRRRHHTHAPTSSASAPAAPPAPARSPVLDPPSAAGVGVVSPGGLALLPPEGNAVATVGADTSATEMPEDASARLRFSDVAARNTAAALAVGTVAVVSTATEEARSRRRENCSVTDAMDTLEDVSERACATPATYASRRAVVNSVRVMASVAMKVTAEAQSEHTTQGPPSAPVKPAEQ